MKAGDSGPRWGQVQSPGPFSQLTPGLPGPRPCGIHTLPLPRNPFWTRPTTQLSQLTPGGQTAGEPGALWDGASTKSIQTGKTMIFRPHTYSQKG